MNENTIKEALKKDGISFARNPKIQNMLRMIGFGENVGSGFPKIIAAWKETDWGEPQLLNKLDLDEVELVLPVPGVTKDVVKDVVKEKANATKEFAKAQRQIYKLISQMPQISAAQMSENMGISLRQVQRYLKQLSDQNLIVREGGRKNGVWKILDDEYEGFFKRI